MLHTRAQQVLFKNDSMEDGKFYEFLFSAFKCMYDVCADGASIYVFFMPIRKV